jgi:5-methylthioadenosine/S-adenosylhomocysteine deaminase
MATQDGARVLGWEDEIGSLEPGKAADLVVLDLFHPLGLTGERVLSDIVYRAGPRDVRTVMVAGEIILEDGRFVHLDEADAKRSIASFYANL